MGCRKKWVKSRVAKRSGSTPSCSIRDDVTEGLRFMWHNVALRRITAILAAINFFYFAATSTNPFFTIICWRISLVTSGFCSKYSFAFSLPWPRRTLP